MRFVSIGDLVTDIYYKDGEFIGACGGNTTHNVVSNLSAMGLPTTVFGVCGNDEVGNIAIQSLSDLGVDISHIKVLDDIETRRFYVLHTNSENDAIFDTTRSCPCCKTKHWYLNSLIDVDYIINNINPDDILLFDNLNEKNQIVIDNTDNKKVIDIGHYKELKALDDESIIRKIRNKFEIINFNEKATNYLIERFNLSSDLEIYNLFKPKFMTITRGKKGATFIYDGKMYDFELIERGKEIDPAGAGDSFVASMLSDIYRNNFEYNKELFRTWYSNSNKLALRVVSNMGARGHLIPLYKNLSVPCNCNLNVKEYIKNRL